MAHRGLAEPELLRSASEAAKARRFHKRPQVPIAHSRIHSPPTTPMVPGTFDPLPCLAPFGDERAWHLWWGKVPGTMVMDEMK